MGGEGVHSFCILCCRKSFIIKFIYSVSSSSPPLFSPLLPLLPRLRVSNLLNKGVPADDAPCNVQGKCKGDIIKFDFRRLGLRSGKQPINTCINNLLTRIDTYKQPINTHSVHDFGRLGLRSAAMLISPLVAKGAVFQVRLNRLFRGVNRLFTARRQGGCVPGEA